MNLTLYKNSSDNRCINKNIKEILSLSGNLKNESRYQLMILALDASTKSTGYAIFAKEKLIQYGYFTASSSDLLCRLDKMKKEII